MLFSLLNKLYTYSKRIFIFKNHIHIQKYISIQKYILFKIISTFKKYFYSKYKKNDIRYFKLILFIFKNYIHSKNISIFKTISIFTTSISQKYA